MEKAYIKVFTREPQKIGYPNGLAYSVHFACRIGDGEFQEMNRNYGILFAEGYITTENTIASMVLNNPWIAVMGDAYGIVARMWCIIDKFDLNPSTNICNVNLFQASATIECSVAYSL